MTKWKLTQNLSDEEDQVIEEDQDEEYVQGKDDEEGEETAIEKVIVEDSGVSENEFEHENNVEGEDPKEPLQDPVMPETANPEKEKTLEPSPAEESSQEEEPREKEPKEINCC